MRIWRVKLSEYLKTVVASVFAVGLISVLFPKDNFGKYTGILAGIIVMSILLLPLFNIGEKELDIENLDIETLEFNTNSYIMDEFEKELSENIKQKLKNDTDIDFSVTVYAEKEDEIIEINQIEIAPYSKEYALIVSEYLGVDEGRIVQK